MVLLKESARMAADLQFIVHFFNDPAYLFKTITMAPTNQMDEICNTISSQKGWYWPRFSPSERQAYLERRHFVERQLYEDYTRTYGSLKESIPVFFYLYPHLTPQGAVEKARQRVACGEAGPHVLLVRIQDIPDTTNLTFTMNDSHISYWKRAVEAGIPCRGDAGTPVVLPHHNRVFPFSMIEEIHQNYRSHSISYEVQVWDYQLLETLRYTVLERE
jgi:hypothetical protein